jgi:hypothetical protein
MHRGAKEGTLLKLVGKAAIHPVRGAIAQLGERIVRNDEVVGSIPTSSTKSFNHLRSLFLSFSPF